MGTSRRLMLQLAGINPDGWSSWKRFLDTILEPSEDGHDLCRNIQALVCMSDRTFLNPLGSLISRLRFLRRLALHDVHEVPALSTILKHCPILQDLSIHGFQEITTKSDFDSSHIHLNTFAYTGPVNESTIVWLLERCPKLEVLNLNLAVGHANLKTIYAAAGKYSRQLREMTVSEMLGYRDRRANRVPIWVLHQEHTPWLKSMALTRDDFPVRYNKWEPDRVARVAFHGITHLSLPNQEGPWNKELDLILRCTPALVSLIAPHVSFQWMDRLRGNYSWYDIEQISSKQKKRRGKEKARQRRLATRGVIEDYPVKNEWQCSELRTLNVRPPYWNFYSRIHKIDNVGFFYQYLVDQCPKITWLTLNFSCLHIGQRILQTYDTYSFMGDYPSPFGPKVSIKTSNKRAPNVLHVLRGLENLFSLTLSARSIPGVLAAEDLSFLRRPSTRTGSSNGTVGEEDEAPIWPRLACFKVYYKSSPQVHSRRIYNSVVADLTELRPEVHFEITHVL